MIDAAQRFTRSHPCPICGGCDDGRLRGHGIRCYGFLGAEGAWAFCTREQYAGVLDRNPNSGTYAHRLDGPCKCGREHSPTSAPIPEPRWMRRHEQDKRQRESSAILGQWECSYVYTDATGKPLHRTVRFRDPKSFRQQWYDRGVWRWGLNGMHNRGETVLYRLPELLAADPSVPVFLCEGEKSVDRLRVLGLVATSCPMAFQSWRPQYTDWIRARNVVILEDNDEDGWERAGQLYGRLEGPCRSVRVFGFRDMPRGTDVCDFLDAGGTVEQLLAPERQRDLMVSA